MPQNLAVVEGRIKMSPFTGLPESAETIVTRVSVLWVRTWERAIEIGAPSTPTDTPVMDFEKNFRVEERDYRQVDVLLVSFGEKFMSSKQVQQWGRKNNLEKFIHPRVALSLNEKVVTLFSEHLNRTGRVGIVSLEPTVVHENERKVCTVYWKYNTLKRIEGALVLDPESAGWSRDHFIGFDISGIRGIT